MTQARTLCSRLGIEGITEVQYAAMEELEKRGFSFCGHFGYENAIDLLAGMNAAMEDGRLDDYLRIYFGIIAVI